MIPALKLYSPDALPVDGRFMPIIYNGDGTTTLIHRYRKPGATGGTTKRRTIDTQKHADVSKAWAELVDECDGSLTIRFKSCVEHAVSDNGGAGMSSVYARIKDKLGKYHVDEKFVLHYQAFIDGLKADGRAVNTISNYKACIRHSLLRAKANGLIKEVPITDFGIRHKFRERILSADESTRLFSHLRDDRGLFWMVYFSLLNPIRKMDFQELRRDRAPECLVLVGRNAPYMRFLPSKTRNGKTPSPCVLPNIDQALLGWFARVEKEFPDCPYFFPRIQRNKRHGTAKWYPPGNFWKSFRNACSKAGISDFHIHDLRHNAFTLLRQSGLAYEDIKKLGMQATDAAIRVYDQSDAMDVLDRIRARANNGINSVSHFDREIAKC